MISYNLDSVFRPLNEPLYSGGSSQLTVSQAQEFAYLLFTNIVIVQISCSKLYNIKLTEIHLKPLDLQGKGESYELQNSQNLSIMTFGIGKLIFFCWVA